MMQLLEGGSFYFSRKHLGNFGDLKAFEVSDSTNLPLPPWLLPSTRSRVQPGPRALRELFALPEETELW